MLFQTLLVSTMARTLLTSMVVVLLLDPARVQSALLGLGTAPNPPYASRRHTLSSSQPRQLAAFYQAHSRPAAVNASLALFRSFYPDADVLMINDGGLRGLKAIARHYRVNYMYVDKVDDAATRYDSRRPGPLMFTSAMVAVTWLSHIFQSLGEAQWVLNLEDDVHVLQRIELDKVQYDVAGPPLRSDVQLPDFVRKAVTKLGGHRDDDDWGYNGCGGSLFRGDFLRKVLFRAPWVEQVREIFAEMPEGEVLGADQVVSALVYANGGTTGGYPGYAETWNPGVEQRLEAGEVSVLHQAKAFYSAPFSFEMLGQQAPLPGVHESTHGADHDPGE